MEKSEEVKVFEVKYFCEDCELEVSFSGRVQPTYPQRYIHVCKGCSKEFLLGKRYPSVEYKTVEK